MATISSSDISDLHDLAGAIGREWARHHPAGEPRMEWGGMSAEDYAALAVVCAGVLTAPRIERERLEATARAEYEAELDRRGILAGGEG